MKGSNRRSIENNGFATLAIVFLFVCPFFFVSGSSMIASNDPTVTVYAHKNTSPLNSGLVSNTTTLFQSSTQTVVDTSATSSSQMITSWDLYPCLASSLTINTGNIVFSTYINANTSLAGVTYGAQVNEIASCGSGSETTLFGGEQTTSVSLTTTSTKFQVSIAVGSQTTIPSGDTIHFIVYVNPGTTHPYTITVSYDSASANTNFALPVSAPVTVNSLTLSPQSITNPQTSTATVSVSDAFGLYDIASASLSASVQGVTAISSQSMSAASGNSPTAYTGSWTTVVNPSATSYASYSGSWFISSTVTDQSGNTYSSASPSVLTYSGSSGNCVSCTTASGTGPSNNTGGGGLTLFQEYIIFATIVIIALLGIMAWRRR